MSHGSTTGPSSATTSPGISVELSAVSTSVVWRFSLYLTTFTVIVFSTIPARLRRSRCSMITFHDTRKIVISTTKTAYV